MSHRLCRAQSGFGLPFTIFILVVLATIGLAVTALEQSSAEMVAFDVQSTRAFMAAESGVELGMNRLIPPAAAASDCSNGFFTATPSVTFSAAGLETCTATVTCRVDSAGGDDYYSLTSRGSCGTGLDLAERVVVVGLQ
jgi:MSHA biogenesis protein MshP